MRSVARLGSLVLCFGLLGTPAFAGFSSRDVFLPVVGRVAGQGGLQAYTTMWATNLSSSGTLHFTFRLLKQGQANSSPASFTDSLAPGETKIYENVIEEKLHLSSAIGAGRITADGEIFASERIYNQANPTDNLGTTEGLFFAAVPASAAIGLGQNASIQGINQGDPSENMRYNFALIETTGQSATVHVTLVNNLGAPLGAADFPLQPYEQIQPNVTAVFPAVSTINARLVASVTAGAGKVILAGAQVANTSLDGTGFQMNFPYPAARTTQTIAVGSGPEGLAFDGANMWVMNNSDSTVQKIPVAAGFPDPPIAVGSDPEALLFDGANIWVASTGFNESTDIGTLQKIPVATGVPGPPINVGHGPQALAFDGANIWVANFISNTVQKVPVSTGVPGPPIGVGGFPSALAFDGSNIWVANLGDDTVQKIPVATGVAGPPIHVGNSPDALVFDGTNVWVTNRDANAVQKIPVLTAAPGPPISVGHSPEALAFDGANIWVANRGDTTVQTIPVATGVAGPPIAAGHTPAALAFDGANMWVANGGDDNVQREGFVSTEFYLPVVGRVAGQGGLQAYTTIWATNLSSSSTRHFTFRFLKQGQTNTSPASFTDALAPGETKIYENVIEEKLNLSSGIGAGRITADGEIFASERIYNQAHPADNLGTTEGLFFAGVPAPLSIGLGEKASIQGVNQGDPSEDMRYNFALVETSGYAATVHVALVNNSGATLGAADFPLQPYEQIQPNVTAVFPAVSTINARLVASVTAGAGKVILAGAQVANTSLDGTGFEMSFKEPPAINVGNGPRALAFDGASVWVANEGDGTVQKIPVATGVPGPPIAVGGEPVALAFDGASVWFANFDDRTVQKIPISTGVPGPPIGVGASPLALVFDGASIWVACGNTVRKIPVATGVPGPAINLGASPDALTFDGTNIWVAILDNTVRKIPIATGIPGPPISVGAFPRALAFDGASIWVANQNGNTVQKIPVATGVAGSAIGVGSAPFALAFDGANMWVANKDDNTVRLIPIATGVPGPPIGVGIDPVGLVFDGVNMWVATEGDGTVQKR